MILAVKDLECGPYVSVVRATYRSDNSAEPLKLNFHILAAVAQIGIFRILKLVRFDISRFKVFKRILNTIMSTRICKHTVDTSFIFTKKIKCCKIVF